MSKPVRWKNRVSWVPRRMSVAEPCSVAKGGRAGRWRGAAALLGAALLLWGPGGSGCGDDDGGRPSGYTEDREPCAEHNPLRNAYFGELHVHTGRSFDAYTYGNQLSPADVYRFAKGEPVQIPTRDATAAPITVQLDRPLDFAMVTDHAEFLGEVRICTQPDLPGYDSGTCQTFRRGGDEGVTFFGMQIALPDRERFLLADADTFDAAVRAVWQEIQEAAEQAYDRTAACSFVSFVGYEYTVTPDVANLHRNVIFRNATVPALPVTSYEAPTHYDLWRMLAAECLDAGTGCDVMSIGHNSNLSNGHYFIPEYPGAETEAEQAEAAALRARLEPLVEIFQHKGDMECRNGLSGVVGEPDPLCDFEKQRPQDAEDCGDGTGSGGMRLGGCVSRYDFVRYALLAGLAEAERIGVNPYRLGIVAATDSHNATAGYVYEDAFHGHVGDVDNTPQKRLAKGNITHDTYINNPGGLTGVWAEERSRDAIFDALRRREVFATSGPRIQVRLFGGWDFPEGLCGQPDWVAVGYGQGVPMGDVLPDAPASATAPTFVVWAQADPGTPEHPGTPLQRLQVVKGWLAADGSLHYKVFEVAGDPGNGATVNPDTCAPEGDGADVLCAVWTDPEFDPSARAFYYARAVQNPTCRWSTWDCLRLPPAERPEICSAPPDPVRPIIQERAWSSPIWYAP